MKRRIKSYVKRILILVSVLMLTVLLCGCRTRVTNNTDVVSVINDEGGMLLESYQIRRDELGIPIAEPPLFPGSESDDEDYEDYGDEEYEDFEDEEYEEDFEDEEEEEEEEETVTTTTRPGSTTPIRRPTYTHQPARRPTVVPTTTFKVTLDLNSKDAKCSLTSIFVRKGSTYGTLPTPTRTGYEFKGWYTSKTKGSKITSATKVTKDKAHTIYAQWSEIKEEKKTYTITFDGNGEEDEVTLSSSEMTVEEGGTYGDMPSAKRKKYTFSGWFTDPEGGSQVSSGGKFSANEDQTLYAHWEFDPYTWWNGEFATTVNDIDSDSEIECIIDGGDDTEEDFLKKCKVRTADSESSPAYIVKFIKNYDEETAEEEARKVYEKYSETNPDAAVVIISDKALKGSKEQQLLYKMKLVETLYGSAGDVEEAETDMLEGDTTVSYPYVYYGEQE